MDRDNGGKGSRVAVVTGASAGIGAVVAGALAAQGWRVIALGRDKTRAEASRAAIRKAAPDAKVDWLIADLSVMAEAARAAREVAALTRRIELLVNNAGGTPDARHETVDGYEGTFAGNHLGPFLFTLRLLPLLRAARGAQIINVTSSVHGLVKDMFWDDLQLKNKFSTHKAYSQSKLANLLFARELAKREQAAGIRANAVQPGMVRSNFHNHGDFMVRLTYRLGRLFSLTPEQGADTILWLATASEAAAENGGYFIRRKRVTPSRAAQSDDGARRLWEISEKLIVATGA
jgi:retinol dehydrogenase 12